MGCGGSTQKPPKEGTEEPTAHKDEQAEQKTREADTHQPDSQKPSTPTPPQPEVLPAREKNFPGTRLTSTSSVLFLCHSHIDATHGLLFAAHSVKDNTTYSTTFTDEETAALKDTVHAELEWAAFWRSLNNAFGKGAVTLNASNMTIDIKMKQSKEPKDLVCKVPVKKADTTDIAAKYFLPLYARVKKARAEPKDGKERGPKESEYLRKECELALAEAILEAGNQAEQLNESTLPELKIKGRDAMRAITKQEGQMAKMNSELNRLAGEIPSHPLDTMYAMDAPKPREFKEVEINEVGWDTDVIAKDWSMKDVALCLLQHYDLVQRCNLDIDAVKNYLCTIEDISSVHNPAFHNSQQSAQMLCAVHHLLTHLKSVLNLNHEDILSVIIACTMYNAGHEGVDDTCHKRAGSTLSMLYSDVYANNQNCTTVAFEVMSNPHCNVLGNYTVDGARDIVEMVREVLFIKANVQMMGFHERLKDFANLTPNDPDWNLRVVLTHVVSLAHYSIWAGPQALQERWCLRLADEHYAQGDKETSLGLAFGSYPGTHWETDRAKHGQGYASGMVAILEQTVIPLATCLAKLCKPLQPIVDQANTNKAALDKDEGRDRMQIAKSVCEDMGRLIKESKYGTAVARPGPDGLSVWITLLRDNGHAYADIFTDSTLREQCGRSIKEVVGSFETAEHEVEYNDETATLTINGGALTLGRSAKDGDVSFMLLREIHSSTELRTFEKPKDIDRRVADIKAKAENSGNKALQLKSQEMALRACIKRCNRTIDAREPEVKKLEEELAKQGCDADVALEKEDALAIKKPPDCKDVDLELLKILKSEYTSTDDKDEDKKIEDGKKSWCKVVIPYISSEFAQVTSNIANDKRQLIYDLIRKLDDWDYNVFDLQEAMSGGISGECMRNQPNGGALFVTMYALCYKWRFMQMFKIDEQTFLNWLSIVEAGYHPNPYHNSMHAADVLHVTHYIMDKGGCKAAVRATDQEVFAVLFAAAIHDYNHPGINNAFHVRSQNYLAVLFNDRSVNENIHSSSVFELMRMDEFNILKAFEGEEYTKMREDIVEFVLGTDMGLHSMFVTRFKKRIDDTEMKMHRTKKDKNLAITMALKMADISNCGRPKALYHGWCNVIVDEFFQQGDRERLQGMPVSPFMDRYTTVMSKGQIGFMNYIVMPLFECMGDFLDHMQMATSIVDENKGFWQMNEDW